MIWTLPSDEPDPGFLFLTPYPAPLNVGHLIILDNHSSPVFYRRIPGLCIDFKQQPGGLLTYFDGTDDRARYYGLDSAYSIVDSFLCGNGYWTDLHDLQVLDNGHALLMSYDFQPVRMDTIVKGGDSTATVVGLIIQEIDADKNVVFQWRSWDHFDILDGSVSGYVPMDSSLIDYVHGNAVELDYDGNILISSRHMNEITKISRTTGEIIWRLGLNARNNDFAFVNDSRGFSHQHDIRRLQNGNISIFDNGNFLDPEYSRAAEYDLDETQMTATLVWEYRNSPDTFGPFMGNVQRLPSGKTLIGWGGSTSPNVTEVHPDGSKSFELAMPPNAFCYRGFRFPWRTNLFTTNTDSIDFGVVAPGDSSLRALNITNNSAAAVEITCLSNSDTAFMTIANLPVIIPPGSSIGLSLMFRPSFDGEFDDVLYVRSVNDTELAAQPVALLGTTLQSSAEELSEIPDEFHLSQNYPNPFNPSTTFSFSIPQSSIVNLTVFDLLGREVALVVNEKLSPGTYRRQWDATGLPSGVYFYRLGAGSYVEMRKLLLLR